MIFPAGAAQIANGPTVSLRCPGCRQNGTFTSFANNIDIMVPPDTYFGQRRCPNPKCLALVFAAWKGNGEVVVSYPEQRIDFDTSAIPKPVATALEEAITCHAHGCFTAAGIMVRKTLEELCDDRGAAGKDLKERIAALSSKVVVPKDLLDGVDDLRLLGNDAAHIQSKTFNQVGQQEVEVAIDFAKEVLKAVYQYQTLVQRIQALKKP